MRYEELTIEGRNAVLEAFRSGKTIDRLFVQDGCKDGPVQTIVREAKKQDTVIQFVPKERLDQISGDGHHQGVVAYAAAYRYAEVEDMLAAARMAKLAYIVNVIIDEDKKVVAAFAGDPETAHRKGCDFLLGYCQVKPERRGDIVISSNGGYPLDQNIYQSVKGLTAAEAAAAEGGVLIMVSSCMDGAGGDSFYHALRDASSPQALTDEILATPQDQTKPDQWEFQILARVLCKHRVIYVTVPEQRQTIEDMKMEWAPDVDTALERARQAKGADAHLVVIPNGISVMVRE